MAKLFGKQLARSHGVEVNHALYRKSGDWYHILREFPGALMDEGGLIVFQSQDEYAAFIERGANSGVKQNLATNTLIVRGGISAFEGYVPFEEPAIYPDELPLPDTVTEGARRQVVVNSYERDASARRLCIKKWGVACEVCGFNFGEVYGDLGEGFIHVHHLTPISLIKAEYVLAPERDMRPVCPNCHAMLHRRDPPLSIEELRNILRSRA